jgi:hypothetical protein
MSKHLDTGSLPDAADIEKMQLFASVEQQIELFSSFEAAEKVVRKYIRKAVTAHNKPLKPLKNSTPKPPRNNKKSIVNSTGDDLVSELVRMASSNSPNIEPVNPTNPPNSPNPNPNPNPNPTETTPKKVSKSKSKVVKNVISNPTAAEPTPANNPDKAAIKAALKAAKDAEKAALKAAEKALKDAEKAAAKLNKNKKIVPSTTTTPELQTENETDNPTETELDVEEFYFDGKHYLIDSHANLYDPDSSDIIGKFDHHTNLISLL